jgi:hypothetical protein
MIPVHIVKRDCPNKKQFGVMSQLTSRPKVLCMPSHSGVGHVARAGRFRRSRWMSKLGMDGTDEGDIVFGGDTYLSPV